MKEQYGINPDWFDWNIFSYFADVIEEMVSKGSVERISADKDDYQWKDEAAMKNRILFDWTTPDSFHTFMQMLEVNVYSETRRNETTRFTALKLSYVA